MTPDQLRREYRKAVRNWEAADARQMESWDKPAGVQRRITATVEKHNRNLARLERMAGEMGITLS